MFATWPRSLLDLPPNADPVAAQRARDLRTTACVIGTLAVLLLVVIGLEQPQVMPRALRTIGALSALCAATLLLNRRGRTVLGGTLLIAGLMAVNAYNALHAGGIRSPGIYTMFIYALLAGLFVGQRGALAAAAVSGCVSLAFAVSEKAGWFVPGSFSYDPMAIWLLDVIYLGLAVAILGMTTRTIRSSLKRVEAELVERRKAEEQLRQSQKMDAFGKLAGGVAHDFNNILTAILGYGGILRRTMPPEDPRIHDIDEILKAGERAASLTAQLLAFSRKQILSPTLLDLNVVVADIAGMLRRLIGADVQVALQLDPRPVHVRADKSQLDQVLLNLAVNARDAMPQGGFLRIATGVDSVSRALLSVSDTGTGMADDVKARIFEPFFTTKGPGKGTGLGLSVVEGIVEQSGGRIDVESAPGRGTTFRITLPLAAPESAPVPAPAPARGACRRETILLVDDDAGVRELSLRVLRENGYTVLEAGRSEEALSVVAGAGGAIDLLVTDVVLPGPDGRQLADRIVASRPGSRVLFMSGYTDDTVVRKGIACDQIQVLRKPFTPELLLQKVHEVLGADREA